jgi:hypothetical protein
MIQQGKNKPLNQIAGTLPYVADAMDGWMMPLVFGVVTKTAVNGQAVEDVTDVAFNGVIQPLTERQLMLKPEGERAWTWYWVHADTSLVLQVDAVIRYLGVQYRVMSRKDWSLSGYIEYHLVQDYTGSGPEVAE